MMKQIGRPPRIETSLPVFDAAQQYIVQHGYGPTMTELAEITGLCKSNVFYHLNKLMDWGYLKYDKNKARTIVILRKEE